MDDRYHGESDLDDIVDAGRYLKAPLLVVQGAETYAGFLAKHI